jgi:hypothetical protein
MRPALLAATGLLTLASATLPAGPAGATAAAGAQSQIPARYIEQVRTWAADPIVVMSLNAANDARRDLTAQAIQDLDQQWRRQRDSAQQPLIAEVLASPLSGFLMRRQAAAQGVLIEAFVMGAKGLNVGQSAVTTDLWQGDEAKFQQSYAHGADGVHFGPVETKADTGRRAQQVSLAIVDPDSGDVIGAITAEFDLDLIAGAAAWAAQADTDTDTKADTDTN